MIDLTKFIDPNHHLLSEAPWNLNGWTYACQGNICIRVPTTEADTILDGKYKKQAEALFNGIDAEHCIPWPNNDSVSYRYGKCNACDGKGYEDWKKCQKCQGEGEINCPTCEHDMTCDKCNGHAGSGTVACPQCVGKKSCRQVHHRVVDGKWISGKFDRLIVELPNVRYQPGTMEGNPVQFAFDGGEGVVMPMRQENDEDDD